MGFSAEKCYTRVTGGMPRQVKHIPFIPIRGAIDPKHGLPISGFTATLWYPLCGKL